MDNLEKVEKLRERANVSYEEAREALEQCNWDILDAMIYLEKKGKTTGPQTSSYSTYTEKIQVPVVTEREKRKNNFEDGMKRFGQFLRELIRKGNTNFFVIDKDGRESFRLPITVLVLAVCFAFWVTVPLLIIGLFLNLKYHFDGPNIHAVDLDINKAMDTASKTANDIKTEFQSAVNKERNTEDNSESTENEE